jgi:hypothetical protein
MGSFSGSQIAGLYAFAMALPLLFVSYFVEKWQQKRAEYFVRWVRNQLSNLCFYETLLLSKGAHVVDNCQVWADGPYTVVIKHRNKAVGLIGFECEGTSFRICQLQGIKGRDLFGLELGTFLLEKAEVIARTLRMEVIRVSSAHQHPYFYLDERSDLYPQEYKIQKRMREIYNRAPEKLGYKPEFNLGDGIAWRRKRLRKKITLVRAIKFHLVLYNRFARRDASWMLQSDAYD